MISLHLHIWDKASENEDSPDPKEEIDLECSDVYDDHIQFVATQKNGDSLELRLFLADIPGLVQLLLDKYADANPGWIEPKKEGK